MVAALFPLAVVFLLIGVPVFMAMIIPSLIVLSHSFPNMDVDIILQQMVGGVNSSSILAIPFFIFAADIISNGQIGKRLVNLGNTMVGFLPGGLAMGTVITCLFFGAISGTGSAAIVAIGGIVYPVLIEKGYKPQFVIGLILASSSLAMLIPPSIALILYSTVAPQASVGNLFSGGLLIGALVGAAFMIYCLIYAIKNKIPREPFVGFKKIGQSILEAGWSLGLPIVILAGIYMGFTTITEAAALAVAYAVVVEVFVYKGLKLSQLWDVALKSGVVIGMLLVLIAAGKAVSYVMTIGGLPQMITELFGDYSLIIVMLIITLIFLITGMFLDPNSAIIILVPLITPVAFALGVDPVHLGLIIVLNLTIGMITPPFGLNIFIAQGTFKIPYAQILPGLVPFIAIAILLLLFVTYLPDLVMWFPEIMN
ncbi:TRAP transporter large permease [Bacillus sp. ISL-37]|uniref:TRAP transporter large permease n=1 Tax=Bacillus sp. ISL-37 TaxID=2819123 RepID=UPI001BE851D0|nr:TRAP transporter large permease [Bacillus sp. ISL-37]MBT2686023.1 TRAP transporter large permease [Bacillus sp. ISL-37]